MQRSNKLRSHANVQPSPPSPPCPKISAFPSDSSSVPQSLSDAQRAAAIDAIAAAPAKLRAAVRGLSESQLDTPYRPDGWTVRQVVHHVPDSHTNAYMRFKLALTEDTPTIKPYDEAAWAKLDDVRSTPIETSLVLLESLHDRWVRLLRSIAPADFDRAAQSSGEWNDESRISCSRCTPGMASITSRTSPIFARETAGRDRVTRRTSPATI